MELGAKIGAGRTSDVYAYGAGAVVKVPQDGVPKHWAALEARSTSAVRRLGLPVPEVKEMVEIDGRPAIVFERIAGDSLWSHMLADPGAIEAHAQEFAKIHRTLQSAGIPTDVPDLIDRMCIKVDAVEQLTEAERAEANDRAHRLPRGAALLHGDFHPGNVLMSPSGPVIIDWFDATVGHPVADVVRSTILLSPPPDGMDSPHLPGATAELVDAIRPTYLREFGALLANSEGSLDTWRAVVAASRLSEGAEANESVLLKLWAGRPSEPAAQSPLPLGF